MENLVLFLSPLNVSSCCEWTALKCNRAQLLFSFTLF